MGCLQQIYTRSGLLQGIIPLVHFMDGAGTFWCGSCFLMEQTIPLIMI